MKIVVIGLGSMGKRRIRLIKEMYPEFQIAGIDGREDRRNEAISKHGITCYETITDIKEKMDCAFVCTSPLSHADIITECLDKGWHVFTEINLVADRYADNIRLAQEKNRILFLSSTFLYREEINYIRSKIEKEKKWNYIYHVGQYLPTWHPWENYKDFFVGNERTNGCRELMAIEFPWLAETFGEIASVNAVSDKMSDLDIGYSDNYMIQIRHENGNKGVVIVDVVSPVAVRKLEAYAENVYLSWGGTPDSLSEFDTKEELLKGVALDEKEEHEQGYSRFIVENAYKNEIQAFFETVVGHRQPSYGFAEDKKILEIIDSLGA